MNGTNVDTYHVGTRTHLATGICWALEVGTRAEDTSTRFGGHRARVATFPLEIGFVPARTAFESGPSLKMSINPDGLVRRTFVGVSDDLGGQLVQGSTRVPAGAVQPLVNDRNLQDVVLGITPLFGTTEDSITDFQERQPLLLQFLVACACGDHHRFDEDFLP